MALSSASTVADALAQWNDNLSWQSSLASANAAAEAARFLLANRAKAIEDQGSRIDFESIASLLPKIEAFIGVGPRAFGRSRRVSPSYQPGGIG